MYEYASRKRQLLRILEITKLKKYRHELLNSAGNYLR